MLQVIRSSLEQIRDHAASEGAPMIIVLLPPAIDPKFVAADFHRLHAVIDSLGVPVIDLGDTFRSVNLTDLQVVPDKDVHPNVQGHAMIFENLYAKLHAQPNAWAVLVGNATASVDPIKASATGKGY
jgi:hypothetical protein